MKSTVLNDTLLCSRAPPGEDIMELPLYDQVCEDKAAHHTPVVAQQPFPHPPSGNYQLTTCPAYIPNSSGCKEGDKDYDYPRVFRRNQGQNQNVTTGDGITMSESTYI